MGNEVAKLPFTGGVDLDGKPFTLDETSVRKTQNLIPDKAGNLVRRGTMQPLGSLVSNYYDATDANGGRLNIRADGAISNVTDCNPIWLAPLPTGGGLFALATCKDQARMDICINRVSRNGENAVCANALDTAPTLLPTVFGQNETSYIIHGPGAHGGGLVVNPSEVTENGFLVTPFAFAGTGNDTTWPHLSAVVRNRVVYGNFGPGNEGTLLWSDRSEPTVIGDDALINRSVFLGGTLTALHPVMTVAAGSPAQSGVLALKRKGAFFLSGEPTETDDPDYIGDLQITQLSSSAGCVSQGSICDTPWGTIWCGPTDVWFLPFGSIPIPIGRKLSPILKAQPEKASFRIHAAFSGGFYRLALFSEGQGPDESTPLGEQWWLDLRTGPPESWQTAQWYGPQVFKVASTLGIVRGVDLTVQGTSFMCTVPGTDGGQLYGVQLGLSQGFTAADGELPYVPNLVTYDNPNTRDIAGTFRPNTVPWISFADDGNTYKVGDECVVFVTDYDTVHNAMTPLLYRVTEAVDPFENGVVEPNWNLATAHGSTIVDGDITWSLIGPVLSPSTVYGSEALIAHQSKEYDFGTRMMDKLFQGIELSAFATTETTLDLTQLFDAGRAQEDIRKYLANTTGPTLGDDVVGATADFAEQYFSYAFWSPDGTRQLGKTVQLKLTERGGITLPYLDPILVGLDVQRVPLTFSFVLSGGPVTLSASLSANYWENLPAFAADLCVAMQNAINDAGEGGTVTVDATGGRLVITSNLEFYPELTELASRNIWGLLGMLNIGTLGAFTQTSSNIVYDTVIGNIGFNEGVIRYRPFKRRPNP